MPFDTKMAQSLAQPQTSQKNKPRKKYVSLSLSPSPPPSLPPLQKHALKVPITFLRINNKLLFSRDSCVNEVSECPEGNFKIILNCTTTSPTKCKGCAEGHYFNTGYGEHGGCVACSQPCGIFKKETRKCETAHDRLCAAWDPNEILGRSKPINLKNGPRALTMPPQALFLIIHTLFPILVYLFIYFLLMSVKETYSLILVQLVCSG